MAVNAKIHVSEQKFNVPKCKTMRLDESYRLVTTVLVLNNHCGKILNIFLTTIAAGFLFLSLRRGSDQFSTAMDTYDVSVGW